MTALSRYCCRMANTLLAIQYSATPAETKKPSTSEVLDWIQALQLSGIDPQRIADEIPYAGVLLKKNEDLDVLHRAKG